MTGDGKWLAFSMLQGFHYWPEMCVALGIPELVDDPRFATHELLFANGAAAAELGRPRLVSPQPMSEWKERLRNVEGQWAPVQDSVEIADDPMVGENGYLLETTTQNGVAIALVTTPIQFDEVPSPPGRSPGFNEHGDEILATSSGSTRRPSSTSRSKESWRDSERDERDPHRREGRDHHGRRARSGRGDRRAVRGRGATVFADRHRRGRG